MKYVAAKTQATPLVECFPEAFDFSIVFRTVRNSFRKRQNEQGQKAHRGLFFVSPTHFTNDFQLTHITESWAEGKQFQTKRDESSGKWDTTSKENFDASSRNLNMAIRNVTNSNNSNLPGEMVFNFSLKLAYDIILKSQQSDVLVPETELILILIYVILMTSGVFSNVLVCFVAVKQCARKKVDLQKSRNLFIVNLAVADLALCCICMPFTLIALIQREWTFGSLLCKLVPVVQGTNITVSAGTIMAIAFDRYNTIVKSTRSNGRQHRKCSIVVTTISLIWLFSFIVNSPLIFYTVIEFVTFDDFFLYEKCIERWPSKTLHSAFTITLALVQFVIPVLVLTIIHIKISSYLKFHVKPLKKTKPVIQIHSPNEPIMNEKDNELAHVDEYENQTKDLLQKELLCINRKESIDSENSHKSCDSSQRFSDCSRKNSESSRKNSDSSRNSFEFGARKKSDFFLSLREPSDIQQFLFSRFSNKTKSTKRRKRREIYRNRRTTFILSCIAVVYAISWLPMTIFQIVFSLAPGIGQNPKTVYVIFAFCHILAMTSAVTNPLLYGWLNTNFRREFSTIFACLSNSYSKLFKTCCSSSFEHRTSKVFQKSDPNITEANEVFAQIPKSPSNCVDRLSPEYNMTLNYNDGKLSSNVVVIEPYPESAQNCGHV